jgi:DNA repair protein RadC
MRTLDMPKFVRPSVKLARDGVESLDDGELLAILLWKGSENEGSLDMSYKLLKKYNLDGLGNCSLSELKKECDCEVKALRLLSIIELCKRYNKLKNKGYRKSITCSKDVYDMFVDELKDKKKEHFFVLLLDTKNKVIKKELISVGTLNCSLVHPREVFKSAIKESANSIILVHNHPSGDCEPSHDDKKITKKMMLAGEILGIDVVDHIIFGNKNYYSFRVNLEFD